MSRLTLVVCLAAAFVGAGNIITGQDDKAASERIADMEKIADLALVPRNLNTSSLAGMASNSLASSD